MKRKTFYHISLALPYIILMISGIFTYFAAAKGLDPFMYGGSYGILLSAVFFFSVSGIIWGPLYTWMVVVILFWGRGKNASQIRSMYLLSPVLLGCSMGMPVLLLDPRNSSVLLIWGVLHAAKLDFIAPAFFKNYSLEASLGISLAWAFMAALCLVIGYAFVGIVLLIEKTMQRRGLFREDEDIGKMPLP